MKKLFSVVALTLAINFIAVAGGVGYLYGTKKLDREKVKTIREIIFPAEVAATTQPTTAPSGEPEPMLKLEELVAAHAGRPSAEQVQLLQRTFDSRMAQLDRRQREIEALHDLVKNAEAKLTEERKAFDKQKGVLDAREAEANRLASDTGFQESLQLYGTMKPKQVKDVFAGLADDVVVRYLRAMQPRQVSKILAEYKTPAELDRVKALIEQVRSAESGASAQQ